MRSPSRLKQRGAALLVAMIILTLVATLAASMVWQQYRAIQVESAERGRQQSAWILTGALDWAKLILREDARSAGAKPVDHLGEPWAVPLAEARLSTFLAADKNNTEDSGPDAFLSGSIEDAQSRFNLMNLVPDDPAKPNLEELAILTRLCENVSASSATAQALARALSAASSGSGDAPVLPQTVDDLVWLGIDPGDLKRLKPFVTLLPRGTAKTVNINTAPREVIAAVFATDLGTAERLVQTRQREPIKDKENARQFMHDPAPTGVENRYDVFTEYFEVRGQVRLGDRVLEERSLVHRKNADTITVEWRRRVNLYAGNS